MDSRMDGNPTGTKFAAKNTFPINNFFYSILNMGFYDCMSKFNTKPVQTIRHTRSKYPWEIDHMFAIEESYKSLVSIEICKVPKLSYNDPIIANFKL